MAIVLAREIRFNLGVAVVAISLVVIGFIWGGIATLENWGSLVALSGYTVALMGAIIGGIDAFLFQRSRRKCPHCGTRNDLDATFCKRCGKQLS